MKVRMRSRSPSRGSRKGIKRSAAGAIWRTRINAGAFVVTLAVLCGQEFTGSWARESAGLDTSPFSLKLQGELAAITASTFTLPQVPPPPPPGYRPGRIVAETAKAAAARPVKVAATSVVQVTAAMVAAQPIQPPALKQVNTPVRRKIFGAIEFRTRPNRIGAAWSRALARMDNELPLYAFCDQGALKCPKNFQNWRRLVAKLRQHRGYDLLQALNSGVNALVAHSDDADTFGTSDHWASPMEFLEAGGDCEDYTILKYATLVELGLAERDMRIVVVKDTRRNRGHAVLSVRTPRGEMILDNLNDAVRPDTTIPHYKPFYSLNRHQHYLHIAARLSRQG